MPAKKGAWMSQHSSTQGGLQRQQASLPPSFSASIDACVSEWVAGRKVERLWKRDGSLWTGKDEGDWLGWLDIVSAIRAQQGAMEELAREVQREGFTHCLLLGMGGSSLCPEVLKRTFGRLDGHPELFVLDSTDPAQVLTFEKKVDLAHCLFIVSSKSGSTLEPNLFLQYFLARAKEVVGADAGRRFVAVTDPGSKLEAVAKAEGFRRIFAGVPSIGGRYSALSAFGVVPAAVMGLDLTRFLDAAERMVEACRLAGADNPGLALGATLGTLAKGGRDKLTLLTSPGISALGGWLEQLIAESTGKEGAGIIPVDLEPLIEPDHYGADRVFVYLRLEGGADAAQDAAVTALEKLGQPVIRIAVASTYDLGQEFFRWEFATAVAGAVLGIHTFNQPDVEASKIETKKLTEAVEKTGALPHENAILEDGGIRLYADPRNAEEIARLAGSEKTLEGFLHAHLSRIHAGDYLALLAYIEMNAAHEAPLQEIRRAVLEAKRIATCLGFGPRFLHSTGQAYKGGPNSAVVLQITCENAVDLAVPGQRYTFGVVKAAQARGDFEVLAERGRRALRVHLGPDVSAGLVRLRAAITTALRP